jgi:long-chain acyl-CoA synthetase
MDAAFIRFTSGTTADSKGVILSHADVAARVEAADAVLRLGPDDRILWTLSLAYHFAVTITAYLRAGAHVLLCQDTLPQPLVDACVRERATLLYGSPLQFARMAHAGRRERLGTVRTALSTTAALPPEVATAFEAACGVPLGQAYGIIEAGLPCINTRAAASRRRASAAAVPGYEVAIVTGRRRARSRPARWARSASGHRDSSPATTARGSPRAGVAPETAGSSRATSERSTRRAAHAPRPTKSTIVVAGMKVFPEEVEAVLDRQPGVRASRVVGRAHPRMGEVPVAEIVPSQGDAPIRACSARRAPRCCRRTRCPIEFRVVDAIPRTAGARFAAPDAFVSVAASGRAG